MNIIYVSAACLVSPEGQILLAGRPEGKDMQGLWEFPGGKIEQGETPEAALVRELKEELAITVNKEDLTAAGFVSHCYNEQNLHVILMLFICKKWQGTTIGNEGQKIKWIDINAIVAEEMPAADIPLLELLKKLL